MPATWFVAWLMLLVLNSCGSLPPRAKGPVQVVATIAPLADWSRIVGGTRVSVTQLVPADHDPRSYVLTAADRKRLAQADILLFNGYGLEPWLETLLQRPSFRPGIILDVAEWVAAPEPQVANERGPSPLNGELTDDQRAQLSQGNPLLPTPTNHSPYQWLDPQTAHTMITLIAQNLTRVDPNGLLLYRQNAAAYDAEVENLDHATQRALDRLPPTQFDDMNGFMGAFRNHFKFPAATKPVVARPQVQPLILVDALNPGPAGPYTLQRQHGKGRIDPLNNNSYLALMRTVTQQLVQSLQP
ncbi:MAG: zinc ABC transporter substrate-binding protein [Herpetosiphonaceae bacterium]|nr:zinc ABC transporter substrate-binding protein [Herpetosiphonaceae bacterium]